MEDFKPGQFNNQYKAHPILSELIRMPPSITEYYADLFSFIEIDGDLLPFTSFQFSNWNRCSKKEKKIIVANIVLYKKGFIDGVNKSFIPFVDTAENRIAGVLNVAIVKKFSGFHYTFNINSGNKLDNDFKWLYDIGKTNGELYKAWTIIFENTAAFKDYFEGNNNLTRVNKNKPYNKSINTFEKAAKDIETLNTMLKILSEKMVIDDQGMLIKSATTLFSLIKRFKKEGYFKTITIRALHPLINDRFKTTTTYQNLNQAPVYQNSL